MRQVKVVSLFSGGGGLDLGFIKSGYQIVWASDYDKNVADTYRANIGDHMVCADINDVDIGSIPSCGVVIGGPPCQSFSLAGKRQSDDDRGRLVWKYMEIIKKLLPKAFVFENVTGLLSAKDSYGKKILPKLVESFSIMGYSVNYKTLDFAEYGVPQHRRRVLIVGIREGGKIFVFPQPTHGGNSVDGRPFVSVEEALSDLPLVADGTSTSEYKSAPKNDYQRIMRKNSKVITDHDMPQMSKLDKYIVKYVKPGGNYMDIPKDVPSRRIRRLQESGGHTTCYGRMHASRPSYTINTYFNRPNVGCNIHYKEDRLITVREALRLQGFSDDYRIVSTSKHGRNLIVGNAVPPIAANIIAEELKKYLGDK